MAGRDATIKSIDLTMEAVKRDPEQYTPLAYHKRQEIIEAEVRGIARGLQLALDLIRREDPAEMAP